MPLLGHLDHEQVAQADLRRVVDDVLQSDTFSLELEGSPRSNSPRCTVDSPGSPGHPDRGP